MSFLEQEKTQINFSKKKKKKKKEKRKKENTQSSATHDSGQISGCVCGESGGLEVRCSLF